MMQLQIIPHHSGTHQAWWYFGNLLYFWNTYLSKKTKKNLRSLAFIVDIQQSLSNLNLKKLGMYVFLGGGVGRFRRIVSDVFRLFGRPVYRFGHLNSGSQKHFSSFLFSVVFQQKRS